MRVLPRRPIENRFWEKVEKRDGCWGWKASKRHGYGQIQAFFNGRWQPRPASIVSWEIHFGPVPSGTFVCHTCDNRECTNPAHLWLGTYDDNMADMRAKGRMAVGRKLPQAKLSEDIVRVIRSRSAAGESCHAIARAIGYSRQAVDDVVAGRTWKHVV